MFYIITFFFLCGRFGPNRFLILHHVPGAVFQKLAWISLLPLALRIFLSFLDDGINWEFEFSGLPGFNCEFVPDSSPAIF